MRGLTAGSPAIAGALNSSVGRFERWSTPFVAFDQARVPDPYRAGLSGSVDGVRIEADDLAASSGCAILAALRSAGRLDAWCAPSIAADQIQVEDLYSADVSVSASGIAVA